MSKMVLGFMFSTDRSEVALIRKNRPAWQEGKWNGIGGKVEKGEVPLHAMRREFREETGVTHAQWEQFGHLVFHPGPTQPDGVSIYLYRAVSEAVDRQELKTVTDEKVEIFRVDELPYHKIPNLDYLVPMALDKSICFSSIDHLYHGGS